MVQIFLSMGGNGGENDQHLNFRKFKVALNPMYRICLNFAKSCISSCLSNSIIRKNFTVPLLKLGVFLAGHSVAMVTYCQKNNTKVFTSNWAVFLMS